MSKKLTFLLNLFLPIICLGADGGHGGNYHLDGSIENMGIIEII